MKKLTIITLILAFILIGCQDEGIEKEYKKPTDIVETIIEKDVFTDETLNHYIIEASLDTETSIIYATQTINYTNIENVDLTEIYLHLYPNAFSKESQPSIVGNTDSIDDMHGKIEISSLKINEVAVNFVDGPTTTSIKIPYEFKRDTTYEFKLEYVVRVSSTSERFGVINGIYNLGNWYPILAVYDEDGWNVDPYLSIGDPFYSDVSNYDVRMTVPKDFVVAGSGYVDSIDTDDTSMTYNFRGDRMRDFAFVISDRFEYLKEEVNDTTVYLYYPKSQEDHKWIDDAMLFGVESIKVFEKLIGDYPYKSYSVVLTNFPTGMEYPGLVLISESYLSNSIEGLRTVIVHETAHQWFYGIIGDDEIDEGWIDEGLTSFFTAYFDIDFIGEYLYENTMQRYEDRLESLGFDTIVISKSAYEFKDWDEYGAAAYAKPALMYHEIRELYGDEKILEFAKHLYDQYAYKILKEEDLRKVMVQVYGKEINELLDRWLY